MIAHADAKLKIDLEKAAENYKLLASISENAKCAAVVKENAYGLGIIPISKKLYSVGYTYFFVATLDEAIELRSALLSENINIYVFNDLRAGQEQYFVNYNLVPIINNLQEIVIWSHYSCTHNQKMPTIIHIDTGMQRLGMCFANFIQAVSDLKNLDIKFVMSHLACADEENNEINRQQLELFQKVQILFAQYKYSLANSAGILLGKDYHFDLLRPGCALYGNNPNNAKDNQIQNVVSLHAPIIDTRTVAAGSNIGYGTKCVVKRNSIIATVPIGYADGYLRYLSDKSYCYIDKHKVPVVGHISMDLITLDITDVADTDLGTMVEVIGDNITVNDLAQHANTISYEILTSLGNRYNREYICQIDN